MIAWKRVVGLTTDATSAEKIPCDLSAMADTRFLTRNQQAVVPTRIIVPPSDGESLSEYMEVLSLKSFKSVIHPYYNNNINICQEEYPLKTASCIPTSATSDSICLIISSATISGESACIPGRPAAETYGVPLEFLPKSVAVIFG